MDNLKKVRIETTRQESEQQGEGRAKSASQARERERKAELMTDDKRPDSRPRLVQHNYLPRTVPKKIMTCLLADRLWKPAKSTRGSLSLSLSLSERESRVLYVR